VSGSPNSSGNRGEYHGRSSPWGVIESGPFFKRVAALAQNEKTYEMRIVLTNDDGIAAPGLLAARQTLEKIGDVLTVAPDRNRSGVGRSITFGTALHVEEREMADGVVGYACTGTPVDCVRLVALGLMDFEPDIVVSGINHGENLGDDITYSGTVAGAMEGIVIGVPGIAVSLSIGRPWHETTEEDAPLDGRLCFEPVADFTARLAKIAFKGLPQGRILNVNAPNLPKERLKGARVTKLGRRFYKDELIEVRDAEGRVGYDIYNNPPGHHDEDGTDFAAIGNDQISVTPVHLELTDSAGLEEIESWGVGSLLENG
jgi:5'-nucleotidase